MDQSSGPSSSGRTSPGGLRASRFPTIRRAASGTLWNGSPPGSVTLSPDGVILNVQHQRYRPLARTGGGGLTLTDGPDACAPWQSCRTTADGRDVRTLIQRGVLRGLSVEVSGYPGFVAGAGPAPSMKPSCPGSPLWTHRPMPARPWPKCAKRSRQWAGPNGGRNYGRHCNDPRNRPEATCRPG